MSAQPNDIVAPLRRSPPVHWTRFFDPRAARKEEIAQAWADLIEHVRDAGPFPSKSSCWWLKLARFGDRPTERGALRHDANVIEVTGVEGDYDGEQIVPEEAIARLERHGVRAAIYTSPSSRPDAPRWRVLAPLSHPHPPAARRALLARINGALGGVLASESFTLSQAYYYGQVASAPDWRVLVTFDDPEEGSCVDELDDLDSIANRPESSAPRGDGLLAVARMGPVSFADAEQVVERLGRKLRRGDGRRALLMSYIGSRSARGFAACEVKALVDAFVEANFDPDSPRDDYRIEDMIAWAVERDEGRRQELEAVVLGTAVRVPEGGVVPEAQWDKPRPITASIDPMPYPIDGLPDIVRGAVEEVAAFVQAPIALVATSALAAASVAAQAVADVKRAERLEGPCALFLLAIADSGERKSTCDRYFTAPIRDYERARAEAAKEGITTYAADLAAWNAEREGVQTAIKQAAKSGDPTDELRDKLRHLETTKPIAPKVERLLYVDATPEALTFNLSQVWPSAGLISAEAGGVFGAHGMARDSIMRNLSILNQLWDGTEQTFDRRTSESYRVAGARLTLALQVQEPTLRDFFVRSGDLARGTGFLARFLIAWPASTQGTRLFVEAPPEWPARGAFHERVRTLLAEPPPFDENGVLVPQKVALSPEAKSAWIRFHDDVELELRRGGDLYDVRDVAAKAADNAARLACVFHVMSGSTGSIRVEHFDGAARIVAWHLHESRRFFGELAMAPDLLAASKVDDWLRGWCRAARCALIPKKTELQFGPVRKAEALDAAIGELVELGRVRLMLDGRKQFIEINPLIVGG